MPSAAKRQLIVFDFDWSMADEDTDHWIFEVLAPGIRRKMNALQYTVEWTDLIAQSLAEIHELGFTREQIEHTLRIMPFHPAMVRAVINTKAAASPQTMFLCLSSANSVFISTILESKGLQDLFTEIVTNPAEWDPSGLLKLRRRIDPHGPQHKCTLGCGPNMCKGNEMDTFLAHHPPFDRVVYVGDGSNDFCPAVRLRGQDVVICRRYRGLEGRIKKEGGVSCRIEYWAGAWEVEEFFTKLQGELQ